MRLILFAAVVALAAGPAYAAQTTTVEPQTTAVDAEPKMRKVCRRENDVNSRMGKKVCRLVPIEDQAVEAKQSSDPASKAEAESHAHDGASRH